MNDCVALKAEDLTAGYGDIVVLRNVQAAIGAGQVLGVLGRNGMGKTTLIRALSGEIPPVSGRIEFNGEDVSRLSAHRRARRGMTTVIQGRGIFPRLTVREHLTMGRVAGGGGKPDRTDEVIEYFPILGERRNQLAGTLSGGEQQMLAIGTGLMTDPSLILLDEPSDGVMPKLVEEIAERLGEINRSKSTSIVIVEQNVPMVFALAHQCIILANGEVVASGSASELEGSDAIGRHLAL
jgi:ABC-type branched-subunit amino acid transport system ATPase component